jgi:hypothetical protein
MRGRLDSAHLGAGIPIHAQKVRRHPTAHLGALVASGSAPGAPRKPPSRGARTLRTLREIKQPGPDER